MKSGQAADAPRCADVFGTKGVSMIIKDVCNDINNNCSNYRIGSLQEIRGKIKNLDRVPTYSIFNSQTIDDDWAFHVGGRSELQFNVGNEKEGLRYGFAFSLKPSRNFPDPSVLFPKILKLNAIIVSSPNLFLNNKMWIWDENGRTAIHDVREIQEDDIKNGKFIFIGKIQATYDLNEILQTFDDLLDIYISVENTSYLPLTSIIKNTKFVFSKSSYQVVQNKTVSLTAKSISIVVRHTLIQTELEKQLIQKYGAQNVVVEHIHLGNRIDIVVKDNTSLYFYEIKVGDSAKSCIRQALGQLFEYTYFPNNTNASKMIVVGEPSLDKDSLVYINHLNSNFNIPIEYLQVII